MIEHTPGPDPGSLSSPEKPQLVSTCPLPPPATGDVFGSSRISSASLKFVVTPPVAPLEKVTKIRLVMLVFDVTVMVVGGIALPATVAVPPEQFRRILPARSLNDSARVGLLSELPEQVKSAYAGTVRLMRNATAANT